MRETGREEVEQRKREKGLAEKAEEKGVGKEVEVGNERDRNENWKKKGAENVNEGARN